MTFRELKKQIKTNIDISKKVYICNFFTCNNERMKNARISVVKNLFGEIIVTKWLDYEYGKYSDRKAFFNKDLAADYAWKLFKKLQH